jgi:hypothetical protein
MGSPGNDFERISRGDSANPWLPPNVSVGLGNDRNVKIAHLSLKVVKKNRGPLFSGPLFSTPLSVGVLEVQEGSERIQSGRRPAFGPHRRNINGLFENKGSAIGHQD